jgi:hypothetical protein
MMATTDTGVTMTSGAPVVPSGTSGGGTSARALRLPWLLSAGFGIADRLGAPSHTR